jgi:hypothetical protein
MSEAIVRTRFGEIRLTYSTTDELEEALKGLKAQVEAISEAATAIVPAELHSPKPGMEMTYRFTPTGLVELLIPTRKQYESVGIVLFAYFPEPVTSRTIELCTGIEDVARKVLSQTVYKDYFRKIDDRYALTWDGFTWVTNTIVPSLQNKSETGQA